MPQRDTLICRIVTLWVECDTGIYASFGLDVLYLVR